MKRAQRHAVLIVGGWIVALLATALALWPIAQVGIIGDDLIILLRGTANLQSPGLMSSIWSEAVATFSDVHFIPVAAVLTNGKLLLSVWLGTFLGGPDIVWAAFRVVEIILVLAAATWALDRWLWPTRRCQRGFLLRERTLSIYLISASALIAFLQVHAVNSLDPVLSYGLASWGTVLLGLIVFALCARLVYKPAPFWKQIFLIALFGLTAALNYEMAVASQMAIIAAVLVSWWMPTRLSLSVRQLIVLIAVLAAPIAVVLAGRLLVAEPYAYSGTSRGYTEQMLPTLMELGKSVVPLSSGREAGTTLEPLAYNPSLFVTPILVLALMLSGLVILGCRGKRSGPFPTRDSVPRAGGVLIVFVYGGLSALVASSLFAMSSKYQVLLDSSPGSTYLSYSLGVTALTMAVSAVLILLRLSSGGLLLGVMASVVVLVSIPQWLFNQATLEVIAKDSQWTRELFSAIAEGTYMADRCALMDSIPLSSMPTWYQAGILMNLDRIQEYASGERFCDAYLVPNSASSVPS